MNSEEGQKVFQAEIQRHNALPPVYSPAYKPAESQEPMEAPGRTSIA
jgi:hypothetical protein